MNEIFLMIECCNEGEENSNILSRSLGLDEIKALWQNFLKKNNLEINCDFDLISKSFPQEIGELGPVKSCKWMKC